jgi:hypothetical protein
MPDLIVRGRCHPPQFTDPNYRGWTLLESEATKIMPKYVGKPVYIDHDKTKPPVGKVKSVYRDKDGGGSIVVDLALDSNNAGWDTMKRIQSGDLPELSLGYHAHGNDETGLRTSEASPIEISICKRGAMPDALIFAMKVDDHAVVSSQKSKSVYTSPPIYIQNSIMTTEQEHAAATSVSAVADPLSMYSKDELARLVNLGVETESKKLNELKEAFENLIHPAWQKMMLEDKSAAIPNLGQSFEKIMSTEAGRDVINLTAKFSGNFLSMEKKYMESQAQIKLLMDDKQKADASRKALESEDERRAPRHEFSGIAPMFTINNSGSETDEPASKRMRVADMFGGSSESMTEIIKNQMKAGNIRLPTKSTIA